MNTLDHLAGPAHGSKGRFYTQKTGPIQSPTRASADHIPQDQKRKEISRARQSEPPKKKLRTNDNSPDILQDREQTRGSKFTKLALGSANHSIYDLTSTSTSPSEGQQNVYTMDFQTSQDEIYTPVQSHKVEAEWALHPPTAKSMKRLTSGPTMVMSDDDKEEQFTKDATRQRHRAEYDDGILEVRRNAYDNGSVIKTVPMSIPPVRQQLEAHSGRIQELDEIIPDEILWRESDHRSSPDIIQQEVPIADTEPRSSRRSRTILADVRSNEPPQARVRKTAGDYEDPKNRKLFRLERIYFHGAVDALGYVLVVDKGKRTFSLDYDSKILDKEPLILDIPVDRIHRVIHGEKNSKLKIFSSKIPVIGHEILLELNSHKLAIELAHLLLILGKGVNVEVRADSWLDRVFARMLDGSSTTRRRMPEEPENVSFVSPYFTAAETYNADGQRDKPKSDHANSGPSFGVSDGFNAHSEPRERRSAVRRRQQVMQTDLDERPAPGVSGHTSRAPEDPAPRSRTTRISSTLQTSPPPPPIKYSQTGKLGEPWQNPLTYPRSGRKRATVIFDDLKRLDDDEFLNDNLIAFFLRYLEHCLEQDQPDIAKRAHFFNSYFYEKLRQKPKDKKSAINYEGVKKWTDKIDLFNRDFVIVPVNENFHWYVAIICNLSWFRLSKAEQDALDEAELLENSVTERQDIDESANDTQQSLQELSLEDRERQGDILVSDLVPETSSGSMKKKKRKRKSEPHLKGVNSYRPTIITLDSLNLPRYAAVSVLKHYIIEEASVRLNKDIASSDIQGLSAKKIPTQNNYSDCGLYVCAYLERFAMAPRSFIQQELRRMPQQWPELRNHDLRGRMRDLLLNLHKIEEGKASNMTIPKVGEILLPPGKSLQINADLEDEAGRTVVSNGLLLQDAELDRTQNETSDSGDELQDVTSDQGAGYTHATSVPPGLQARISKILSSPITLYCDAESQSVFKPEELSPAVVKDDPSAMAKRMREDRSPTGKRIVRSGSVSTDFLHGTESYEPIDQQMQSDGLEDKEIITS